MMGMTPALEQPAECAARVEKATAILSVLGRQQNLGGRHVIVDTKNASAIGVHELYLSSRQQQPADPQAGLAALLMPSTELPMAIAPEETIRISW